MGEAHHRGCSPCIDLFCKSFENWREPLKNQIEGTLQSECIRIVDDIHGSHAHMDHATAQWCLFRECSHFCHHIVMNLVFNLNCTRNIDIIEVRLQIIDLILGDQAQLRLDACYSHPDFTPQPTFGAFAPNLTHGI